MNAFGALLADTVTVYNHRRDSAERWDKAVIRNCQWKRSAERIASNGIVAFGESVSVTIMADSPVEGGKSYIRPERFAELPDGDAAHWTLDGRQGDIIALGSGPDITGEYTIRDLKRDHPACVVKAVGDNANAPFLRHWQIKGI